MRLQVQSPAPKREGDKKASEVQKKAVNNL
jgi:hypothetical protein